MFECRIIRISQNKIFRIYVDIMYMIYKFTFEFFTEIIKFYSIVPCCCCVKCSLQLIYPSIIVFHVIGKNYQLCNIDKFSKCRILKSCIDSISFGFDSFRIIRFFNFYKTQR